MNEEIEGTEFENEGPIPINDLQDQTIEIDAANLEVIQTPELLSEVLITLASMIGEETGAEVYQMSGEVSAKKATDIVDQSGEFSQTFKVNVPVGEDEGDYNIVMHGAWNVAEHDTISEDGEDLDIITRMTVEVTVDKVERIKS